MPNWCTNRIEVSGSKAVVNDLLNHLLVRSGIAEQGGFSSDEAKEMINRSTDKVSLSSFFKAPYPQDLLDYDTTNHPFGKGLEVGKPFSSCFSPADGVDCVTEELIQAYRDASQRQMDAYGVVGWYDYNIKYLGCKWDMGVDGLSLSDLDDVIYINIDTPWSPPEPWASQVSRDWDVTVRVEFVEEANLYPPGWSLHREGECVEEGWVPVYSFLGSLYPQNDIDYLCETIEIETGLDIEEYLEDYILSEEFTAKLKDWYESLDEDDCRKHCAWPVLEAVEE